MKPKTQIEVWKSARDLVDREQQVLDCLNRRINGMQVSTPEDYADNWDARWKETAAEIAAELGAKLVIDNESTIFDFCP